jgi:hypothetical protein
MTRAHRNFWTLTTTTVLATGILAQALAAPASAVADTIVAGSTVLLAISGGLLIRVLRHLTRPETPSHGAEPRNRPANPTPQSHGVHRER